MAPRSCVRSGRFDATADDAPLAGIDPLGASPCAGGLAMLGIS
jgi:hypothetical protein